MSQLPPYMVSLVVGPAIGVVDGLVSVRSSEPPIIALIGPLGMLVGEATIPWLKGHTNVVPACLYENSFALRFPEKDAGKAAQLLPA